MANKAPDAALAEGSQPADSESIQDTQNLTTLPIPSGISGWVDRTTWGKLTDFSTTAPTAEQLCSILGFFIESSKCDDLTGPSLFWAFKEQLEEWETARWRAVPKQMLYKLRTFLLDHGVFVPMDGDSIPTNIERAAQQDDYHTWSTEEIKAHAKRSK